MCKQSTIVSLAQLARSCLLSRTDAEASPRHQRPFQRYSWPWMRAVLLGCCDLALAHRCGGFFAFSRESWQKSPMRKGRGLGGSPCGRPLLGAARAAVQSGASRLALLLSVAVSMGACPLRRPRMSGAMAQSESGFSRLREPCWNSVRCLPPSDRALCCRARPLTEPPANCPPSRRNSRGALPGPMSPWAPGCSDDWSATMRTRRPTLRREPSMGSVAAPPLAGNVHSAEVQTLGPLRWSHARAGTVGSEA